jgi:rfaE bifunctional protein nucleotidyltransferase chain/domain
MTLDQFLSKKIIAPENLEAKLADIRKEQKSIATLNGSFDLLHAGHLEMIYQASLQGDVLLVALNSDSSIKAYKSASRPIIPLEYRLKLMAALEFVDYVTWFHELDPRNFLSLVKPEIHVNGAEYGANCIEADVVKASGGKIHIVELVPGLSTTAIIEKINKTS